MKPVTQWTARDIVAFIQSFDMRTRILAATGLAFMIIFTVFIALPAWVDRPAIIEKIKTIQLQRMSYQNLVRIKPQMIEERKRAAEYIQRAKDRLYSSQEASLLLGAISRLAKETRVTILSSKPKELENVFPAPFNDQYQAFIYDFTVEGAYHDIGRFVSKIESNPKLLRIQRIRILPKDATSNIQTADLELSATSFKK